MTTNVTGAAPNWMLLTDGGVAVFDGQFRVLGLRRETLLADAACALGGIRRAAGRFDWTVLQHSLLVAHLLPPGLKLEGRLHDLHEMITGDIPTPFVRSLHPEVQKHIEQGKATIQAELLARLGYVAPPEPEVGSTAELVRKADHRAFLIEASLFLGPSKGAASSDLGFTVEPIAIDEATREYIEILAEASAGCVKSLWIDAVKAELGVRRGK